MQKSHTALPLPHYDGFRTFQDDLETYLTNSTLLADTAIHFKMVTHSNHYVEFRCIPKDTSSLQYPTADECAFVDNMIRTNYLKSLSPHSRRRRTPLVDYGNQTNTTTTPQDRDSSHATHLFIYHITPIAILKDRKWSGAAQVHRTCSETWQQTLQWLMVQILLCGGPIIFAQCGQYTRNGIDHKKSRTASLVQAPSLQTLHLQPDELPIIHAWGKALQETLGIFSITDITVLVAMALDKEYQRWAKRLPMISIPTRYLSGSTAADTTTPNH